MVFPLPRAALWLGGLVSALTVATRAAPAGATPGPGDQWCAPELTTVTHNVCFFSGATDNKTLVIFLHSLVGDGSEWAWQQQRLMKRNADSYGFSALIPRGRPGLGPGRDPKVLAWPTARALQEQHEEQLIAEWLAARRTIETKTGRFERVLVFGFSNGAYYATSLALRARLDVDGYAVFAGGNGGKYHRILAQSARTRVPMFVGYGRKDPDHHRQESLAQLLRAEGWPHRVRGDNIGHTVSDAQIRTALGFLGHRADAPDAPAESETARGR